MRTAAAATNVVSMANTAIEVTLVGAARCGPDPYPYPERQTRHGSSSAFQAAAGSFGTGRTLNCGHSCGVV